MSAKELLDIAGDRARSAAERLILASDKDLEHAAKDARASSSLIMRELGRREGRREVVAEFAELREQARWPEFVFVVAPVGVIADDKTGTRLWVEDDEGGTTHVIPDSMAKASPFEVAKALGVEPRIVAHLRVMVTIMRGGEAVAGEWPSLSAVIPPSSIGLTNSLARLAGQLLEAASALGRQHGVFPPPDLDQIVSGVVQVIDAAKTRIATMPVDADALTWMASGAGTVIEHDEPRGVSVAAAGAEQAASDTRRDGFTRIVLVDSGARKIEITALQPARPRPRGRLAEAPVDTMALQFNAALEREARLREALEHTTLQRDIARGSVAELEARVAELVGQLEGQALEQLTADAGDETAWPVRSVLEVLSEAAGILLDDHNYDGLGWERLEYGRRAAREYIEGREPGADDAWIKVPVRKGEGDR